MKRKGQGELDAFTDPEVAKERVMLEWLLDQAKSFYSVPENLRAYEAWKKNKEDSQYATHINA